MAEQARAAALPDDGRLMANMLCPTAGESAMAVTTLDAAECVVLSRHVVETAIAGMVTGRDGGFDAAKRRVDDRYGSAWILDGVDDGALILLGEAVRAGGPEDVQRNLDDARRVTFEFVSFECENRFGVSSPPDPDDTPATPPSLPWPESEEPAPNASPDTPPTDSAPPSTTTGEGPGKVVVSEFVGDQPGLADFVANNVGILESWIARDLEAARQFGTEEAVDSLWTGLPDVRRTGDIVIEDCFTSTSIGSTYCDYRALDGAFDGRLYAVQDERYPLIGTAEAYSNIDL